MEQENKITLEDRINDFIEKAKGKVVKVICAWCNKIMSEKEGLLGDSHTMCPDCREKLQSEFPEIYEKMLAAQNKDEEK